MTLPVIPNHTVSERWVVPLKIEAVQVDVVTALVPPGSTVFRGTILANFVVVVSIFGCERHAKMIRKRVTSSSLKNHTREVLNKCRAMKICVQT